MWTPLYVSSAFHSWTFRAAIALLLLLPPASDQISHTLFETQDRDMSKDFASAQDTETFGERKARACRSQEDVFLLRGGRQAGGLKSWRCDEGVCCSFRKCAVFETRCHAPLRFSTVENVQPHYCPISCTFSMILHLSQSLYPVGHTHRLLYPGPQ